MDDFRETVLLNFTAVLRWRMVHDHQLLKDTQVQLGSLYIAQLSQNKHKNASHVAAAVDDAVLFFTSCSSPSTLLMINSWIESTALKIRFSMTAITLSPVKSSMRVRI